MRLPDEPSPLRIGFKESFRSAVGVIIPVYLMSSAFLIGVSELLGLDLLKTAPVILMVGVFLLIGVEVLRRYVLTSRRSGGGQKAVAVLRGVIWVLVVGAVPLAVFLGVGVSMGCFGRACSDLSRIMLIGMLVWAVVSVPMVALGYLLLRQASWLQRR